jgi:hypothetical protein
MSIHRVEQKLTSDPAGGPLFVVGAPRSGTSLVYALMNQHPQIALMYEGSLPFLRPLFMIRRSKSQWLERWNFWNGAVERHRIDTRKIPTDVCDTKTATETVCRAYADQKGATIWGDKSPQHSFLESLAVQFPNARIVIVWRNPADVCQSTIRARLRSPLLGKWGMVRSTLMGCFQLGIERDRLLQRGTQVHEILYEDLIGNPRGEMEKVCEFLGIPFDRKMISLKGADHSAISAGHHNALVKGETIVPSREQPKVLPESFERKIERYKVFWRRTHSDWPIFRLPQDGKISGPLLLERVYDRLVFRVLRRWRGSVLFIYCFAPLALLRGYRALRGRRSEFIFGPHTPNYAFNEQRHKLNS